MKRRNDRGQRRQEALDTAAAISGHYYGEAVFPPPLTEVVDQLGESFSKVQYAVGSYPLALEEATGLVVIHEGIVLGDPSKFVGSAEKSTDSVVESFVNQLNGLPQDLRLQVLSRLAVSEASVQPQ